MNLGIFLGGRGVLSCYIKFEQTLKMGGGQNFFLKNVCTVRENTLLFPLFLDIFGGCRHIGSGMGEGCKQCCGFPSLDLVMKIGSSYFI